MAGAEPGPLSPLSLRAGSGGLRKGSNAGGCVSHPERALTGRATPSAPQEGDTWGRSCWAELPWPLLGGHWGPGRGPWAEQHLPSSSARPAMVHFLPWGPKGRTLSCLPVPLHLLKPGRCPGYSSTRPPRAPSPARSHLHRTWAQLGTVGCAGSAPRLSTPLIGRAVTLRLKQESTQNAPSPTPGAPYSPDC